MQTLVVARYKEPLDWLLEVPKDYDIIIYNKGPELTDPHVNARCFAIIARPNVGRESETFSYHMLTTPPTSDGTTVFSQGDPFGHSPDFLRLLHCHSVWSDIQVLGYRWTPVIPPPQIQKRDPGDRIGSCRVRRELFSLCYWGSVHFFDPGAIRTVDRYWTYTPNKRQLSAPTNLAEDFLSRCGFHDLAAQAARHLFGNFSYGAIFAVRNERIAALPRPALARLRDAANGDICYGYVIERLWLHIFGEPFVHPVAIDSDAEPAPLQPPESYRLERRASSQTVKPHAEISAA